MIYVVDFGGQTAHLITRRLKDLGAEAKLVDPARSYDLFLNEKPDGIIFSGGPSSVYEKFAPKVNPKVFNLKVPMMDICYGLQLRSHLLGGKVISGQKEYGPVQIYIKKNSHEITKGLPNKFTVWMNHGDTVLSMPKGFEVLGSSESVKFAFVEDPKNKHFGVQFHPEIEHTEYGNLILQNFIQICGVKIKKRQVNTKEIINKIKSEVGNDHVIGAVSGGVDSTVAGVLAAKAIRKNFIPIFVDNGLMRDDARDTVNKIFRPFGIKPIIIESKANMLKLLKGVEDSETKRKIIGNSYIDIFEKEMKKLVKEDRNVKYLLQGTIFSDVIESKGSKHSAKIKSHHNVGGLPKNMRLELIEPLRDLYKDEVRDIGKKLGLPNEFINKQPFPGPGYAVRIRGEVTKERLDQEKMADKIVLDELGKANLLSKVFISFPVMTGAFSTAVKGDGRSFNEVVALRIVESNDIMSSDWSRIPYDVLQKISSRIVNQVPNVSRVVYDITPKPPATMEWE